MAIGRASRGISRDSTIVEAKAEAEVYDVEVSVVLFLLVSCFYC